MNRCCTALVIGALFFQSAYAADPFLDYAGPRLNLPPALSATPASREAGIVEASTRTDVDGIWYVCHFEQVLKATVRPYWGVRNCVLSQGTRSLTQLLRGSIPGLPTDPYAPSAPGNAGAFVISAFSRGSYSYKFTYKWLQSSNGSWEWVITDVTITWNGNPPPPVQQ